MHDVSFGIQVSHLQRVGGTEVASLAATQMYAGAFNAQDLVAYMLHYKPCRLPEHLLLQWEIEKEFLATQIIYAP